MTSLRLALAADAPAIAALMKRSARGLSEPYYDAAQTASVTRYVAVLDTQLVADGTYFVTDGELVACGGWSKRDKLFTGTATSGTPRLLDPACEPARIRAMFVDPRHARRGLGRAILARCEADARAAGFTRLELMATLPGVPFYTAAGYTTLEPTTLALPDGIAIAAARMGRTLA